MMVQGTPILVVKEGTRRERGKGAQFNNIAAAKAVAEAMKTTLGPRAMDKMLVDSMGDVVITGDGVTILKEMAVEHPIAKMLVEVAKAQDEECGDGTTSAVILAGELLRRAEELIDLNVHPTLIVAGYRMALARAQETLAALAEPVKAHDEETLKKIAGTAMISKQVHVSRDLLADIAVKAVRAVAEPVAGGWSVDDDDIQMVKKQGGSLSETQLFYGIIVDKERVHPGMPERVENPKIALVDAALEVKKTEFGAEIQIRDPSKIQAFLEAEEKILKGFVDAIKASGANVVFCQKGIDDLAQHFLAKEGIYAVRRVKKSDMEKLAKATGARIVSKVREISKEELGSAKLVYEKKIGDDKMGFVTGCKNPKAVSVLIRGGTEHVVDEAERSLEDALSVVALALEDGKVVTGGGCVQTAIAQALRDYAPTVGGREQIAIEAYADAVEVIPRTLAANSGHDPMDTLIELRRAHKAGRRTAGLNVFTGKVSDLRAEGVLEPVRVVRQALMSATDAAVMILRIDDVIASKAKAPEMPKGGPGGMGGEMGGEGGL